MFLNFTRVVTAVLMLSGCATSPTGRTQFTLMADTDMVQMGVQSFEALKKKTPIETDNAVNAYVRCVAEAITSEVGGEWEVVVFKDASANAFALPGRKIGVHTGLLAVAENQHQLAAVLGHEVAHVLAHHSNERVSQNNAVSQGLAITQAVLNPSTPLGQVGMSLLGVGAQYGILMPFSRTHESEADIYGLELMAKAGFNPQESVRLWQNMGRASNGKAPMEFMSTHPSHTTRIADLEKQMPTAQRFYNASNKRPNCQ